MLVDAARESGNPNLRAIISRQQFTQMTDIVDKTLRLYTSMGGNYVGAPSWTWTFPSGAKIRLAYISTDRDARVPCHEPIVERDAYSPSHRCDKHDSAPLGAPREQSTAITSRREMAARSTRELKTQVGNHR